MTTRFREPKAQPRMPKDPIESRLMRIGEAAQYLGVSYSAVWALIEGGKIPFVSFPSAKGNRMLKLFEKKDLDRWINNHRVSVGG